MSSEPRSPTHLAGGAPAAAEDFVLTRRYRLARHFQGGGSGVLVDFGCGNGHQTFHFVENHGLVVGLDVNEAFLGRLAATAAARGLSSRVHGVRYDGGRLPLADDVADHIISFEVLEHVADEGLSLVEMARILRPGGDLILSVPNRWWVFETHGAELPLLRWNRVPLFSWLPKGIHDRWARARIYRRREIVAKVESVGLAVQSSCYITAPMDVVKWPPLRSLLRGTLFRADRTPVPFLATAVMLVATKP